MSWHCQGKLNQLHVTTGKHEPVNNEAVAHTEERPVLHSALALCWLCAPCLPLCVVPGIAEGLCTPRMGVPYPPLYPWGCAHPLWGSWAYPVWGSHAQCRALCHVRVTYPEAPRGRAVGGGAARSLIDFPSRGGAGFPWKPSHPPAPTPAGPGNAAGGGLPAPPPRGGVTAPGPPLRAPAGSGHGGGSAPGSAGGRTH